MGHLTVLQTIGIPMGICLAPFAAKLYLLKHERDIKIRLIKTEIARAKEIHRVFQFKDDPCVLNAIQDGG